ncbi:phosphosulfolactate synthase [Bacillus alkalicellulosilyticus]|uniref:phosphosulfolactate synthase n=1 Tax=Alkalihalobacterium alkalicellulosilyticum TaxID=1912214 RepID=UPI0009970536|nr:phosphosulfolactate synthase [Bacillus alkalicellulosilyticus]
MSFSILSLPFREVKPRKNGITVVIDNGVPLSFFKDTIESSGDLIDFVKFGWGTSLITKGLSEKIDCLQQHRIEYFFGGTLFEKFLSQDKVDGFYQFCKGHKCKYIEISNGTLPITNKEKAQYISDFSDEFLIFSEVGSKDSLASSKQNSSEWVEYLQEDLEAGATKVITEARESGTSGVCDKNGDMRFDLIDDILASPLDVTDIIFEAPTKHMQTTFIERIGPDVNLANISFQDPIPLETLRLGLRSDTFNLFT